MFDPQKVAQDFPILQRKINGKRLVYLDNGATSQKPRVVIDAITNYYETSTANVHRGVHQLSDESTRIWEESRVTIASFLGATPEELILTRNTTEALNGVALGWTEYNLGPRDVILTTQLEHHANIVPWQEVCARTGAQLIFVPVDRVGRLDMELFEKMLQTHGTAIKLVAVSYVSNVLGTVLPIDAITALIAKHYSELDRPKIVLDAAQAVPHFSLKFDTLGVDFCAFSGHKMLGPMGVGGLLVRKSLLTTAALKPWYFGGGMIAEVTEQKTRFAESITDRFTPGTPDVASAAGLAAACTYLTALDMTAVAEHDALLVATTLSELSKVPEVQLVGPVAPVAEGAVLDRVGAVSFLYNGVHAHDVAQVLDSEGIAVRSGHHCTMPLHLSQNWQATVRVSFQVYNTVADISALCEGLKKVRHIFR